MLDTQGVTSCMCTAGLMQSRTVSLEETTWHLEGTTDGPTVVTVTGFWVEPD